VQLRSKSAHFSSQVPARFVPICCKGKLFKPQGGDIEAGSVEVDGKSLTPEKKEKFGKELTEAVKRLEDVLNS